MSRGIKIMAKDLEVPVITLSQLNRTVENRTGKRPQLSDLRESGSIEQDADIVALLDRSMNEEEAAREDRPAMGETTFIIAKNRSGALADVPLTFLPGSTKFVEIDKPKAHVPSNWGRVRFCANLNTSPICDQQQRPPVREERA